MESNSFSLKYRFANIPETLVDGYLKFKLLTMSRNGIEQKTFEDEDFTLNYYASEESEKPVLLFIHGFGLDAMFNWVDQLNYFAKNYRIIAADLLWFGKSRSTKDPVLDSQREALERLLSSLNVKKVNIVGQSYGGFVATDLKLKNPNLVEKVILANNPGPTFDETTMNPLLEKYKFEKISELLVIKTPHELARLFELSSSKTQYFPNFVLRQMHIRYFADDQKEKANLLDSLVAEKSKPIQIEDLRKGDILMVWGEKDILFEQTEAEKFARIINCPLTVIPNAGHVSQLDEIKAFNKVVEDFLLKDEGHK
ncbi:MAG: alpha/beta hydrolase [Bacteroidota bacterium]